MERPRKSKHNVLLFYPQRCTSCLLCQISCSLLHGEDTRAANAMVRVIDSPPVAHPTVIASTGCDCPDNQEFCQRVCGPEALRFVASEDLLFAVQEGWQISPVVDC